MKITLSTAFAIMILACNNQAGNTNGTGNDSTGTNQTILGSTDGSCDKMLLFRKGAEIQTTSYDRNGKETGKQESIVTKVSQQRGITVSELKIKTVDQNGANEKDFNATYKCDGKKLYVDMSRFLGGDGQKFDFESSGLEFSFNPTVGESLPDFDYSTNVSRGGKTMKISSHIKERKVEAKESITTSAGTFECYKISSVIESETEIPGLDETSKKVMEEVKKKMGKNVMTFWYAPDVTIIKMEFYMGANLITRSEVTGIKK